MKKEYKDFVNRKGGTEFSNTNFRYGASFTCDFGLVERYKVIDNKTEWGFPGIHIGIDRGCFKASNHNKEALSIASPFNFYKSSVIEKDPVYGSIIYLYHKFGFRIMIAHMYPEEIKIINQLRNEEPINENTIIGPAGSNGFSTGKHTHTEVESLLKENEFCEELLNEKFGEKHKSNFSKEQIIQRYKDIASKTKNEHTKQTILDWSDDEIFEDFSSIIKSKKILFINDYKIKKLSPDGRVSWFYSSLKLFNM